MTHDGARELLDKLAITYTGEPYPAEAAEEVRVVVRLKLFRVSGRVVDDKTDEEATANFVVPGRSSSGHPSTAR
jgi:hypothetical protein